MTCLVIAFSGPSGPVSSSPLARAALTSSRTAARSTSAGVSDFFAALSSGLTPTSVSVIIRPFPLNQSARWASYTVTRTVSVAFCQAEQVDRDRFPKYGQHVLQTYLRALIDSAQVTKGHCPVCGEDVSGRVDRLRGGGAASG